jgi:pimeloyl-ACP methyl ester carboxylesterase
VRQGLRAWCATMLAVVVGGAVLAAPPAGGAVPRQPVIEGLFDVDGHRLYLRCTGRGSPTVVMDASLGADSSTWAPIEATLARYTRVCVYDRAGLGRSDPGPVPRTSQTMVDELLTLLRVAGVPGPYVLVGHSLGGLNMQLLARQDGGRTVVGVVLIDATPAEFPTVVEEAGFPVPSPEENPEGIDLRASGAEVLTAPPFPAVPLDVLTHGVAILPPPLEVPWQQLQAAQARFSPMGRLVVARGSGHFIHEDDPRLVLRTIIQVVNEARRTSRQRAA